MDREGNADVHRGVGRMNRNLRLRVGMVRTIVKVEMSEKGDVFPGKAV